MTRIARTEQVFVAFVAQVAIGNVVDLKWTTQPARLTAITSEPHAALPPLLPSRTPHVGPIATPPKRPTDFTGEVMREQEANYYLGDFEHVFP
jgi:hypothetical protein